MTAPGGTADRIATARQLVGAVLTRPDLRALDNIVRRCRITLRTDLTMFALMTDRHTVISASGSHGGLAQRGAHTPFEDTLCSVTLRNNAAVVIADTHEDARVSSVPAVQDGSIGSYLGVPVQVNEMTVGVLCAVSSQARDWTQEDTDTLTTSAAQLGRDLAELAAAPTASRNY